MKRLTCALAVALALPPLSIAYPLPSTLADASVAVPSGDDLALARESLGEALDDEDDGILHVWINPRTGASGTVTAIQSFTRDGAECRDFEVTFQWVAGSRRSVWKLCQIEDGWRLVSTN
jgi:surface antigen